MPPAGLPTSTARRARQTWEQARGASPVVDERIYDNTVEAVVAAIQDTPDDVRTLVVVGHNPSIGELTADLDDGDGDPAARQAADGGFPAGGVAVFTLATEFAAIAPRTGSLTDFTVPGR